MFPAYLLTCFLGSSFHRTRYSIRGETPSLLVTRSARKIFTSFSYEASDGCKPLHFRCLECCFLLPIEFTFPLVTLSMCERATSAHSSFAFLGVLGFGLTWRALSNIIEAICASSSYSPSSIMTLSAFLFGQSRAQCGLSHRKHLLLGVNSFLFILPLPSRMLGILPDPIIGALWSLETSSPPPVACPPKTQPGRSLPSCNP